MSKTVCLLVLLLSSTMALCAQGKLFIIGGGKRPAEMMKRMIDEAHFGPNGYVMILPFASEEPDSAVYFASADFTRLGVTDVRSVVHTENVSTSVLDAISNASLIYISGGDQLRFMKAISTTRIKDAIATAYRRGALVAGTSAGAAMMSEKMITGGEKKYPEYRETFQHVERNNIEVVEGLGLLRGAVIDQHFIIRSRYNRLLTVVAEHHDHIGIGIDESTAILVNDNAVEVIGESQVVVLSNPNRSSSSFLNDKIGVKNFVISLYLPGEKFRIKP